MKKTKKSHFIPKFFIKRFCDDNGNICIYNKETKDIKLSGPSDKAFYKNWLYSYYEEDEKGDFLNAHDNEIEKILGQIETNVPLILNKIDSNVVLNSDENDFLRLFCFIQWARTPNAILNSNNSLSNFHKKMLSMVFEYSSENELSKNYENNILKDEIKKIFESEMFRINFDKPCIPALQFSIELYKTTKDIKLDYDIIKTDKILIFGENPVIIKLPMIHGVEIIMPISTHQLLYIHSINIKNNIEEIIDALNKVQIDQTDKYVFFKVKPDNFDILLSINPCLKFNFPEIKIK